MISSSMLLQQLILIGCVTCYAVDPTAEDPKYLKSEALTNYVRYKMESYYEWMSNKYPFVIEHGSLSLTGKNISGLIDVDFEFRRMLLVGHSLDFGSKITARASLNENYTELQVSCRRFGPLGFLGYGGLFNIKNGTYKPAASTEIKFSGEGTWGLTTFDSTESFTILNFSTNADGYIDLLPAEKIWSNLPVWQIYRFDRISFSEGEIVNETDIEVIHTALGEVYAEFLNSQDEDKMQFKPLQILLLNYLDEIMKENKLEDILSDWITMPPSSTTEPSGSTVVKAEILVISLLLSCFTGIFFE